jgi:predicted RNA-binding protein
VCLSKAYLERDGERQLVAEDVTAIEFTGDILRLKTLFGELKEVGARVREVDFLTHSILLEEPKESGVSL